MKKKTTRSSSQPLEIEAIQLYKPHEGQKGFHADNTRFRILACGRRWGKTIACVNEMVRKAWEKPGSINWWVAPVYQQCDVAYSMLNKHFPEVIEYQNKSKMLVHLKNGKDGRHGSEIRFLSADKPHNLRGWGVDFLVMDEAAFVSEEAWKEALRPALADKKGQAVFIGTPAGKNWFYELFARGMDDEQESYKSFRFSSKTNPHFPEEEWEEVKSELPEEVFKQEFQAEFIERAGMVYPEWNRNEHVCVPFEIPPNWYVYGGVDFGYTNPFAVVWAAIDPEGNYYIIDEYYERGRTMNEHIQNIKNRTYKVNMFYADPSGPQYMAELQRRGLYVGPGNRDVVVGINRVAELLKTNKLKVFSTCDNVIEEFEHYSWESKKRGSRGDLSKEKVKKQDDHSMDALRYLVMSTYHTRGKTPARKKSEVQRWREGHFRTKKRDKKYPDVEGGAGILL